MKLYTITPVSYSFVSNNSELVSSYYFHVLPTSTEFNLQVYCLVTQSCKVLPQMFVVVMMTTDLAL